MKSMLAMICLSLLLILTSCSAVVQESSLGHSAVVPNQEMPPAVSSSVAEPEQQLSSTSSSDVVVDYFITDRRVDGIADRSATETLCGYLLENLSSDQYCAVSVYPGATSPNKTYVVLLFAPDRSAAEKVLRNYSGPWAPVLYERSQFSLTELTQAETDISRFAKEHPKIAIEDVRRDELEDSIRLLVRQPYEDLTAFVENYPRKGIFWISVQDIHLSNPD